MQNSYYNNMQRFVNAMSKYSSFKRKYITAKWLMRCTLDRSAYLKLYRSNIIGLDALDFYTQRLNHRMILITEDLKFDNYIIYNNHAIARINKDKLKYYLKEGYAMYNKEDDLYYVNLTLILYNTYRKNKDYVRTMEK